MLKTIVRHGCRLRPALNMRLSTSLHHRLHTWSPASSIQNNPVRKHRGFFDRKNISVIRFGQLCSSHVVHLRSINK